MAAAASPATATSTTTAMSLAAIEAITARLARTGRAWVAWSTWAAWRNRAARREALRQTEDRLESKRHARRLTVSNLCERNRQILANFERGFDLIPRRLRFEPNTDDIMGGIGSLLSFAVCFVVRGKEE